MAEYILGIDVGGTNIKMMVMDTAFRVAGACSIPTRRELGYEEITDNIIEALDGLLEATGDAGRKVVSLAMGLPGAVDNKANKAVYLAALHWDGFDPSAKLGRYYGAPAVVDNDAVLNTMGEYHFGLAKKPDTMALLTLGTGVGCGIIVAGQPLRGKGNLAAELGHMTIVAEGGEECLCHKRGHLEAYCSGTAMQRYAARMMEAHPETVLHALVAQNGGYANELVDKGIAMGDGVCMHIVQRFARYLAIGVGNVMKLFDPDLVLIGGGLSNAGELMLAPLRRACEGEVLHAAQLCPVEKARLGSKAGMYGACALAAQTIGLRP